MATGEVFMCALCNEKEATLTCSGCKSARYCSTDHQKRHWKDHKIDCKPFKISESPEIGRYLEATRDIEAGQFILTEMPLVVGPKWALDEMERHMPIVPCVGCFLPTPVYSEARCKTCNWPVCRVDCPGLENDRLHKIECGILAFGRAPMRANEDPEAVIDFYRSDALFALKCLMLQLHKPKKWEELMQLEAHMEERKKTPYYEEADNRVVQYLGDNFIKIIKAFEVKTQSKILPECDTNILHKICGIIEVNAMMINLPTGQEVSGIYPTACLLEHNCLANCTYSFSMTDGFKIVVKAGRNIKAGEHLTTSYTHTLWGTASRRNHLLMTKYFSCKCERCRDKTELGTHFSTLKCLGTGPAQCGGNQLPVDPLIDDCDWQCDKCPIRLGANQVNFLVGNMGEEVDVLLYNKDAAVRDLESMIDKLSQFLHTNHYHIFGLKHSLIQLYGHAKDYGNSQLPSYILEKKVAMCDELLSVIKVLDPYTIRLAIYTAIIYYELAYTQIELAQRKLKAATDPEERIKHAKLLDTVEENVKKGKEIIQSEIDTPEGQATLDKLKKLDEQIQSVLSQAVI